MHTANSSYRKLLTYLSKHKLNETNAWFRHHLHHLAMKWIGPPIYSCMAYMGHLAVSAILY